MRTISFALLVFTSIVSSAAAAQYVDFELNNSRFCGLLEDGKVTCTSQFNSGTPALLPDPDLRFTEIQGGNYYTCGITTGGTVECWGDEPNEGQTTPPSFDSTVVKLSVAPYHACAMDDGGTVKCWGQNVHGQTEPPATATDLIDLHAYGIYSTCGVKSNNELLCWGNQADVNPVAPLLLKLESTPMTQIKFSYDAGCIMRPDGTAACYQNRGDQQAFAEFSNGPYKSLFPLTGISDNRSPLTVVRLPETYKSVQSDFQDLIGLTFDDKLVAISATSFDRVNATIRIVNGEIDMPSLAITDAEYYGANAGIELFFTALDESTGSYRRVYDTEIFRDGELLAVTDNYGSYVDSTATTEDQYTYKMRAVPLLARTNQLGFALKSTTTI